MATRVPVFALLLVLLTGCGAQRLTPDPYPLRPGEKRLAVAQKEYVEAHNRWVKRSNIISPSSPDYAEQLLHYWVELKIGEKFATFRDELRAFFMHEQAGQ